jgi:hypothetical protein
MADLSVMSLLSYLKRISHGNQGKEGRGEGRGGRVNGEGEGEGKGRGRGTKGGWKQKRFTHRLLTQHAMLPGPRRLVAGRNILGRGSLWYRPGQLPSRSSVIIGELQAGGNSICLVLLQTVDFETATSQNGVCKTQGKCHKMI